LARPESQAIGGWFQTPTELLAPIARIVTVGKGEAYSVVDPCAADGAAVLGITQALFPSSPTNRNGAPVDIYACEMEATRYAALKAHEWHCNGAKLHATHGDALRLVWETKESYGDDRNGAGLLYLNPPYDTDRECKRLEERFLRRFAPCLADHGVLMFVVPFNALSASADTIARSFTDLHCYVFPEDESYRFAKGQVFKQVVLVGTKRPLLAEPDPAVRARVLCWSESADAMPVLGSEWALAEMPGHANYKSGFSKWSVAALDVQGLLARVQPWHSTDRSRRLIPIPGVVPIGGQRRYPLAVPPKPAHLAAAIASGVFNGAEVTSDDPKLPRLRVKGVFDREFVTVPELDKKNKDGEKTGEVQIQQPKLVVTVLDCVAGTYHTLKPTAESSGSIDPAEMSTGDLLTHYGRGLMQVMLAQCPVLHDPSNPAHEIPLPPLKRALYRAQAHAVMAIVKLISPEFAELRKAWDPRRNGEPENALLLGTIGVGKSTVATAAYEYMRAKGFVSKGTIMCPPHLLQSWADQVDAVAPWLPVSFLESVADCDAANDAPPGLFVLSRETAKLSHAFAGVATKACPKCGAVLPVDEHGAPMAAEELARKRVRCEARRITAENEIARIADDIALEMMLVAPHSPDVNQRCRGRMRDRHMLAAARRIDKAHEAGSKFKYYRGAYQRVKPRLVQLTESLALRMLAGDAHLEQPLLGMLAGINDDAVTASICERMYAATALCGDELTSYERIGGNVRNFARDALLLHRMDRQPIVDRLKSLGLSRKVYGAAEPWTAWEERAKHADDPKSYRTGLKQGMWQKSRIGSPSCVVAVLALLAALSERSTGRKCGEPLYQAIPEPRRVPLAKYIGRRAPRVASMFVLDEAHEAAAEHSAQGLAARRMMTLADWSLELTGSLMNGYAVSLYAGAQARDPLFREEFPRTVKRSDDGETSEDGAGLRDFNRRYGYIKQLVQQTDRDGKVVEWGSQSERKETVKEIGNAPGVLPLFVLKYLLRTAVPLQMSDLALDLPPHREIVEFVEPSPETMGHYTRMLKKLQEQIKADRFDPLLAGKLFGQMSEIGSYLDRATVDTGNCESGGYEVRYPINDKLESFSGGVVASADGLSASTILPKERWMLDTCAREFSEGRRVMIFGWHEAVLPRLQRLVESELGETCALLLSKVQAKKRQDWIDREVIAKRKRVVVLNPACVKTGLNNLVHFHSTVWMENPAVDPQTYRQANGRIDRIGKTHESRAYFPVYAGTVQALQHRLLLSKVAVSMATDGLDAESALQAAGVGATDCMDAMSVGRALFEMLERGEDQGRVERRQDQGRAPEVVTVRVEETRPANDLSVLPVPVTRAASRRSAWQLDLFGSVTKRVA
jgi:hypothetical protein